MWTENWLMPAVVLGLVLLLVMAASVVRRYQQHKAEQRATLRRVQSAIPIIEQSLGDLARVPLSRELRVLLRGDVHSRYKTIRQVHPRYPGIDRLLSETKARMDGEAPDKEGTVPPIENEQELQQLLKAIDRLVEYFEHGGPISGQRVDQRLGMLQHLKERRAEVLCRYHMVQANRLHDEGNSADARKHLSTLIDILRRRGPNTEFVRELYQEAEEMQMNLMRNGSLFQPVDETAQDKGEPSDAA